MRQTLVQNRIRALFLLALFLAANSIISAQGTFASNYRPFSGRVMIEDNRKAYSGAAWKRSEWTFMEPLVQAAWDKFRPELIKIGYNFLNERDVGRGLRTSNNTIHLAEKGYLYLSTTSSGFSLKYHLPGNVVATSFRTPGPLPGFTDPRVALACEAVLKIDVFWTDTRLTVTPATLLMACKDPTGRNITGDLAIGVIGLIKTLGGPDLIRQWLSPVNDGNFALSPQIDRDLSKYFVGKMTANTTVSVSQDDLAVDGSGKRTSRLVLRIEDKGREPKVF